MSLVGWLREKLGGLPPEAKLWTEKVEEAQAFLARGDAESALAKLQGSPPENDYVLATYLDSRVQAALKLRDLSLLESMALQAEILGRLRPEKARFLMLEAEAIGSLNLAQALGEGAQKVGQSVADDLERIRQRRSSSQDAVSYQALAQSTLGRRFEQIRLVGIGSESFVVSAVPRDREYKVAIKFLGPGSLLDAKGRQRFRREASLLERLKSPHILKIYEYHEDQPPYMVMEFYPGVDLMSLLDQGREITLREGIRWGAELAMAAQAAHAQGIFHRNIHPGNAMVSESGPLKLIGFGTAKTNAGWDISAAGTVLGRWIYLSPEQYAGAAEAPTPQMDIFGIGATLHHLLLKEPPYEKGSLLVRRPSPALETASSHLPPALVDLIRRALAEDPKDRYQAAEELLPTLAELYESPEIQGLG